MNTNITHLLLRLFDQISLRRRNQLVILVFIMLASAIAEVVSLGLVIPFLGLLVSPQKIFNHENTKFFIDLLNIKSEQEMVLFITIAFISLSAISAGIRLLQLWASTKLTFATGADLSLRLYENVLNQPYAAHVNQNTSTVISGVIDKTNQVVFWVLLPVMTLASSIILMLFITATLVAINPFVALASIIGFGLSYALIAKLFKKRLTDNSQRIAKEQAQVVKALQEGLGGIRDIILDGTQSLYSDIYRKADLPLRQAYGSNIFISGSPRFVMEAFGIALIAGIAYVLSVQNGGLAASIPVLGALALGAQRLLPALQQSYNAWSSITGSKTSLVEVLKILEIHGNEEKFDQKNIQPLHFKDSIKFENINFNYDEQSNLILNNFNLEIKKGSRLGIIGATGSGKSTLLDLLMGLLTPTSGKLIVDGQTIQGAVLKQWQKTIAHVPQSIYLSDSTIAENIAFGVLSENIDFEKVKAAAQKACIHDYIEKTKLGYNALVGERGIKLSGGQRQRIGIARALYKNAKVIIFDEATSALDTETETEVMSAVENLSRDLTLIIVAHRTSTLKNCDVVLDLNQFKSAVQNNANMSKVQPG